MKRPRPTLSVFLANYNHGRYIEETLTALAEQSWPALEIVVMDDASTDDSVARIERVLKTHKTIRLFKNAVNRGASACYARALELTTGNYLFLPGADDKTLPGFFERSMTVLERHPEAGFCWSDNMTHDVTNGMDNPNYLRLSKEPCYLSADEITELVRRGRIPCLSGHSSLFRRAAIEQAGGLHTEFDWHYDFFLAAALALRHGACYVPDVLTCARITPASWLLAGRRDMPKRLQVLAAMLRRFKSPAFRDVYPRARRSGIMGFFHLPVIYAALANPDLWSYLTPAFLRRGVWFFAKQSLAEALPSACRPFYRRWRDRFRNSRGPVAGQERR